MSKQDVKMSVSVGDMTTEFDTKKLQAVTDSLNRANDRKAHVDPALEEKRKLKQAKRFEKIPDTVRDSIRAKNDVEIRKRISELREGIAYQVNTMKSDAKLEEAKEKAREMAAPYKESIKELDLEIEFAISVLEDQGKA